MLLAKIIDINRFFQPWIQKIKTAYLTTRTHILLLQIN